MHFTVFYTLAYVLFALGCCALAAVAGWLRWRESDPQQRVHRLRNTLSLFCRGFLKLHSSLGLIRVEFIRPRPLGPGLIVANHPSLVDALWILATQPQVCCVLKGDLERLRLLRYLVASLNYVSNRDPEKLLAEGSRRLQAGETLLVFPEGTRTPPGQLPQLRLGAAEMLVRSGAPCHPVVIFKAGSYLSKCRPWYDFPGQMQQWRIVFGKSMETAGAADPRRARRAISRALQTYFHQQLTGAEVAPTHEAAEN